MAGDLIPDNPAIVYRDHGWAGWARLLKTEGGGQVDDDIRSVYLALIPALDESYVVGCGMESEAHYPERTPINALEESAREWHAITLRVALESPQENKTLWWERDLILKTLDKIGWHGDGN